MKRDDATSSRPLAVYVAGGVVGIVLVLFTGGDSADPYAVIGSVAGVIAAAYAFLSYRAIMQQIDLARRELHLVDQDLQYSREQSKLVAQQLDEAQRKPKLLCSFDDKHNFYFLASTRDNITLNALPVIFYIYNIGTRTAVDPSLELLIPSVLGNARAVATIGQMEYTRYTFISGLPSSLEDGLLSKIWPTGRAADSVEVRMTFKVGEHHIFWRAYDNFGTYPDDGSWGGLLVTIGKLEPAEFEAPTIPSPTITWLKE